MSAKVAYTLRSEYEDTAFGGVIGYGPDRHAFDVAENLEAGGGKIVTDDHLLISALDQYPALKRTTAGDTLPAALPGVPEEQQPEGAVTPDEAAALKDLIDELMEATVSELEKEAKKLKLDLPSDLNKPDLVQAIADARLNGDQD